VCGIIPTSATALIIELLRAQWHCYEVKRIGALPRVLPLDCTDFYFWTLLYRASERVDELPRGRLLNCHILLFSSSLVDARTRFSLLCYAEKHKLIKVLWHSCEELSRESLKARTCYGTSSSFTFNTERDSFLLAKRCTMKSYLGRHSKCERAMTLSCLLPSYTESDCFLPTESQMKRQTR
jgi:hypothetical protein